MLQGQIGIYLHHRCAAELLQELLPDLLVAQVKDFSHIVFFSVCSASISRYHPETIPLPLCDFRVTFSVHIFQQIVVCILFVYYLLVDAIGRVFVVQSARHSVRENRICRAWIESLECT